VELGRRAAAELLQASSLAFSQSRFGPWSKEDLVQCWGDDLDQATVYWQSLA
jgi:hypothetical protein